MKKLIGIVVVFLLALSLSFNVWAVDTNIQTLADYMLSDNIKLMEKYYIKKDKDGEIDFIRMILRVDKSSLKDYDYELHFLEIEFGLDTRIRKVVVDVRYYKDCNSRTCYSYEDWVLVDHEGNGKVERSSRDWRIVMKNVDGNKGYNLRGYPRFPKGFINEQWTNPSREEVSKKYDGEIKFWLKNLKYPKE